MNKYLKNCRRLFPIYGKCERQFIKKLKERIQEFSIDFPDFSYEELIENFGSPKEIVLSYYDSIEDDYLLKKTNMAKYLKRGFTIILALAFIYFSTHFILLYKSYQDLQNSIIIHENTTIEELP